MASVWMRYLVLPAGVRGVRHVVAPVLLPDLVLLLRQEQQLLVRRLHVVVEAAQVVLTPLGVFLQETCTSLKKSWPGAPRSPRSEGSGLGLTDKHSTESLGSPGACCTVSSGPCTAPKHKHHTHKVMLNKKKTNPHPSVNSPSFKNTPLL